MINDVTDCGLFMDFGVNFEALSIAIAVGELAFSLANSIADAESGEAPTAGNPLVAVIKSEGLDFFHITT